MIKILLIDDDRMEVIFWRRLDKTALAGKIEFHWASDVDQGLELARDIEPDIILLDNAVPPQRDANFAITALKDAGYNGRLFVWSNTDLDWLRHILAGHPDVALIRKSDYIGMDITALIEDRLIVGL